MQIHTLTPLPVVILAGGLGTRLGQESDRTPKPLVRIGPHPILAHIISLYVNQGHNEFIICCHSCYFSLPFGRYLTIC